MTALIKIVKFCDRNTVIAQYRSSVTPMKGELVEIGNTKFIVSAVHHVLKTVDAGTSHEVESLSHIDIEVLK